MMKLHILFLTFFIGSALAGPVDGSNDQSATNMNGKELATSTGFNGGILGVILSPIIWLLRILLTPLLEGLHLLLTPLLGDALWPVGELLSVLLKNLGLSFVPDILLE